MRVTNAAVKANLLHTLTAIYTHRSVLALKPIGFYLHLSLLCQEYVPYS